MVATPDTHQHLGVSTRLLRMMRQVHLPGEESDHVWMGQRIEEAVDQMAERMSHERGQELLISGLAMEMGLDLSEAEDLDGCLFPEEWIRSVPPLLQCGFPTEAWRLVEAGLLRVESGACGAQVAWRLDVRPVESSLDDFFELGHQTLLIPIVEGLMSLFLDENHNARISVRASSMSESRQWVKKIRAVWEELSDEPVPHIAAA